MGFALSWLAIQSDDVDAALAAVNLTRTGHSAEYLSQRLTGCAMPGGWYVVIADREPEFRFLHPKVLEELSAKYPVIACSVEEHVMFSSAEQWIDGARIWRAEHSGEDGPINLETSGLLPPSFQAMSEATAAEQSADGGADAEVDHYFDLPLDAAKAITGFKHDERVSGVNYARFDVLHDANPSAHAKPWWRFWG